MTAPHKKLIEVALPLEAINAENAREKSSGRGIPHSPPLLQAKQAQRRCARRTPLMASVAYRAG